MRPLLLSMILAMALPPSAALAQSQSQPSTGQPVISPSRYADAHPDTAAPPAKAPANGEDGVTVRAPLVQPKPDPGNIRMSPDATIPPMASALCKDGTYARGGPRSIACDLHGGVSQWLQ